MRLRLGLFVSTALVLVAAATPGGVAQADPSAGTPLGGPVKILSASVPVQNRADLAIDVKVRNDGTLPTVGVKFRLTFLRQHPADDDSLVWHDDQRENEVCRHVDYMSAAVDCTYHMTIAPGATAGIAIHALVDPTSSSLHSPPPPLVKIVAGDDPDTGDSLTTAPVDRIKQLSDFAATIVAQPRGRVGDIVDVAWAVTNNGPRAAPGYGLDLVAPSGTEWVGDAAANCGPPPRTVYRCKAPALGAGQTYSETWQLRIVSANVATAGKIQVFTDWYGLGNDMIDPYFSTLDEDHSNNTAAVNVTLDTSPRPSASVKPSASHSSGPGGGLTPADPSAGASTTPGAAGPLPKTGSDITVYAIVGFAAVAAGAFLLVAVRSRRRARFSAE
ncbi:LPXTG cell wall anchor domain-containing protein [Dactylosporangium sp. McL0621]|uniref:LPXTG cell wall anchor domain-containing protein n=1 Tax=Dactylosporangium sp. McL0621 TaxID=3415678 RepID=UPI003CEA93BC